MSGAELAERVLAVVGGLSVASWVALGVWVVACCRPSGEEDR